jgi:predicted RNase H-like HicB family nuclease
MKQTRLNYPAVFSPALEGGYDVSFPDFPGCVTFGSSFEEAKTKAAEVLELWLEELSDTHQEIPVHRLRPIIDDVNVALTHS